MRRNPRLLAIHPLDNTAGSDRALGPHTNAVAAVIVAVLFAAAGLADHLDSGRRAAAVQAALTTRGLGPARIERLWTRIYRCRQAYGWRTASASGTACARTWGPVEIHGPDPRP
jgi:hypothetical protein